MSFRDGNDFISNEDEEVPERQTSSGVCYHEESELVENTEEMEEEEEMEEGEEEEEDDSNEDYYEEEGEEEEEEEEMDDNNNNNYYDGGTEVKNEDVKKESHNIVQEAPSSTIAAAATTRGGGSVFQQTQNSPTATTFLFTPAVSPSQGSNLSQMMKDVKTHDSSFPSLTTSITTTITTPTAAVCSVSESPITLAGSTKTVPQRHSFRFLDFSTKAKSGAEKRPRFSSLSEETAAAKSFLSRFELSIPTTRFDEQLKDILSGCIEWLPEWPKEKMKKKNKQTKRLWNLHEQVKLLSSINVNGTPESVGMSSWELLHEIRSMDSDSGVETAHSKLLKYVKEEAARHPPLTHNLCQCSMLCGAFCRKLATLDVSIVTDAIRYVDSLLLVLKKVVPSSMESTIFAYAFGEIETFRRMRHVTCRHRIDDLTRSIPAFRWDIEKITTALKELSTTEKRTENNQSIIGGKKRPREENDISGTGLAPVAVRWRLPLRDPISMSVITIPARGLSCQHQEVFDLGTFVRATQQVITRRAESIDDAAGQKWEDGGGGSGSGLHSAACPVCGKPTPLHSVRVDEQIMETMKKYTQKGNVLSAEDCIVWDASTSTYGIEERPSGGRESEEKVDEMQEKEPSRPKRVVHIEGHVLYADD